MKEVYLFVIGYVLVGLFGHAQLSFTDASNKFSQSSQYINRGVAAADFDNDGDIDLFFPRPIESHPNALYINNGDGRFTERSSYYGLNLRKRSNAAIWFDVNADGWLDLYISNTREPNQLFLNEEGNSFVEVSNSSLASTYKANSINVSDFNNDGFLDVFLNNVIDPSQLFMNQGNMVFLDLAKERGVFAERVGMGAIVFDFDQDQDQDLYITFDSHKDFWLMQNDGNGYFENVASEMQVDFVADGMGVDIADLNADGLFDIYLANRDVNTLYFSKGQGQPFEDHSSSSGVDDPGMSWGTNCFDFDNDGLLDIYVANEFGAINLPNVLYRNEGNLTFSKVNETLLTNELDSYGTVVVDYNQDGQLDLVVANSTKIELYENIRSSGHWVKFNLVYGGENPFAVGSTLSFTLDSSKYVQQVTVGSGYASQSGYELHFGLGSHQVIPEIKITWPDGVVRTHSQVNAGSRWLITYQDGIVPFDPEQFKEHLTSGFDPVGSGGGGSTGGNGSFQDPFVFMEGSVARIWNEAVLEAIRGDFARPTVHARNLFHLAISMYDAWAVYDNLAQTYLLGNNLNGFQSVFDPSVIRNENTQEERNRAISYAAYRLLSYRFANSPGGIETQLYLDAVMDSLGYSKANISLDYTTGDPENIGNYIAEQVIAFGHSDGSNELNDFANEYYQTINPALIPTEPGNPDLVDPNRWQPLGFELFIDQSGNEIPGNTPKFLSPEWGNVLPFAMDPMNRVMYERNGSDYFVYHDPGLPPLLGTDKGEEYQWGFSLVAKWAAHHDPTDGVQWDISPASIGNVTQFPDKKNYDSFYQAEGGDIGSGHSINPVTGSPYESQWVPRGDYTRVLAEFWADGPDSETPPGHWFTIMNAVHDHPMFERKLRGEGLEMDDLEWDVKSYFALGGAMHDAAIAAWGIKGWYDYIRPISAIRYMAGLGQSTNPSLPGYHEDGIPLEPGLIEIVSEGDPLATDSTLGKIKLYTWKGPDFINDPEVDQAGVGWILAENWWPYQRPTFVTPPFAGYVSGHSTYSRAAAEVMTLLTGDPYFPGGMGEFIAPKNEFLVFEEGPSVDVVLQWATYRDASDQCSLSRIWGGIHPPADDIPGRIIGEHIGIEAFQKAETYFQGKARLLSVATSSTVSLFPNPVHQGGEVIVQGVTVAEVAIFNLQGEMMVRAKSPKISTLSRGLYIVRIVSENHEVFHERLLIH